MKYIMALDQGTTSSRCILFDHAGNICASVQKEFRQIFPQPGWVEHNAAEIWDTTLEVSRAAMDKLGVTAADIAAVAKACEDAGADGVSLINTLPGMRIDLARRRPLLANRTGGMSGPGMFPLAVRMVYQVYEAVHIPIVGMGGVTSAQDVLELMLAGATAVGVGAANLVEPYACKHIIETLPDAMARFGIDDLRDIIGGAHHG